MQGEEASSGKRRRRGKNRSKEDATPASVDDAAALHSAFIPEQLESLRAMESLIGDLDLTGEQAAIGEEMLIELQGACSELAALNAGSAAGPAAGPGRVNEAAQRVSALAETFSGLLEGAAGAAAAGRRGNA